jgi:hypothetical protein
MAAGQKIHFGIEVDEDQAARLKKWVKVDVRIGDTVRRLAARRHHPEDVEAILKRNGLRDARRVLRHSPKRKKDRLRLWVPGEMRHGLGFAVLAGDQPPRVVGGYAKFGTLDRPERVGVTQFHGYDPFTLEIPIQFEAWADQGGRTQGNEGQEIERQIELLERMAGRGDFRGANVGPPPVVRISSTDANGGVVGLIPKQFQWVSGDPGPLWRITDISWDEDALRSGSGNRLRQAATVTVQQHTNVKLATRSTAKRAKRKVKARHSWQQARDSWVH